METAYFYVIITIPFILIITYLNKTQDESNVFLYYKDVLLHNA